MYVHFNLSPQPPKARKRCLPPCTIACTSFALSCLFLIHVCFVLAVCCFVLYCIVQVVVKRGHYGTVPNNNNSHDEGKKSQAGSSSSSSVPFPNRGIIGSGELSQQPGQLNLPRSICHDADNHLLIVGDCGNHRVEIFDKKTLQFLACSLWFSRSRSSSI